MSESGHRVVTGLAVDAAQDGNTIVEPSGETQPSHSAAMAGLRLAGAQRLDPVQLHYLELLSARAQMQTGPVQRILEAKLAQALAAFTLRLEQTQAAATGTASAGAASMAAAPAETQAPSAAAPQAPRETLGDLVRSMAQHASELGSAVAGDMPGSRTELKSVKQFRNTWSKLSADKQVARALDQAPRNAGPINSHMLVLRSLALMREISPDYLNRFMSYADSLLCLDQHDQAQYALPARTAASEAGKKPKTARRPRAR